MRLCTKCTIHEYLRSLLIYKIMMCTSPMETYIFILVFRLSPVSQSSVKPIQSKSSMTFIESNNYTLYDCLKYG